MKIAKPFPFDSLNRLNFSLFGSTLPFCVSFVRASVKMLYCVGKIPTIYPGAYFCIYRDKLDEANNRSRSSPRYNNNIIARPA